MSQYKLIMKGKLIMNIKYEIVKKIEPYLNNESQYDIIKVSDTIFRSPIGDFKKFVVNQNDEHWNKVNEWIDRYIIPNMTRRTINYKVDGSSNIKIQCQKDIGEYVSNDEIKYILAIRGIKGDNNSEKYPLNLYYPLSSEYNKQFHKRS